MLRPQTKVWTSKYLNNIIKQDHRRVKQRPYPMLGFKSFRSAAMTSRRIELAQEIKKGQLNISKLIDSREAQVTQVWEAVLAD